MLQVLSRMRTRLWVPDQRSRAVRDDTRGRSGTWAGRLAALAVLLLSALPAAAAPALWKATGPAGSVVWLFGTVHVLRPTTVWRSPRMAAAFAASDSLWLEIDDSDDAAMAPLMMRLGLDPAHPLSTRVTPAEVAQLDAAAKAAGMSRGEAALEPMRPWLAALTLSVAPVLQAGFDPRSGADRALEADARAAGKPVRAFETAEQQLRFFSDLPPAEELAFLRSSLKDAGEGPAKLTGLVEAWARGEVGVIAALEDGELRRDAPALYRRLIVDRNRAWAERLAARLKQGGTTFVAVGAGHLAGPDSVQGMLQARGYRVERVGP